MPFGDTSQTPYINFFDCQLRNSYSSGAKSGAPSFLTPTTDPNLLTLIEAWPTLPEALKIGILAMIKTAGKG